jgi:hypothetical protein
MVPLRSLWQRNFRPILTVLWELLRDGVHFLYLGVRSRNAAAEILFLRRQLALLPGAQGLTTATERCGTAFVGTLVTAVRLENGAYRRDPASLRPLASQDLPVVLVLEVTRGTAGAAPEPTPTDCSHGEREHHWGEERVADELWLKLGILVSPRTVRQYWPTGLQPEREVSQLRSTLGQRLSRTMPKES